LLGQLALNETLENKKKKINHLAPTAFLEKV
jgi:hypothetical protein